MTPNDPYMTFDLLMCTTFNNLGSVVLHSKFDRNRLQRLEKIALLKGVRRKKEDTEAPQYISSTSLTDIQKERRYRCTTVFQSPDQFDCGD